MPHHPAIANAALFKVEETSTKGRGAFAIADVPLSTSVLSTDIITAHVILRQYKKEVCAQCFQYERGRTLKTRDSQTGIYFCSASCKVAWRAESSDSAITAWELVENFIRGKSKQSKSGANVALEDEILPDALAEKPNTALVDTSWKAVESTAHFILQARTGSSAKPHKRAMQAALAMRPNPNHLPYLLSAVLCRSFRPKNWEAMLQLVPDDTPYSDTQEMQSYIHSSLQLLALLPTELLKYLTAETCREVVRRDNHNSFGIRSLDDGGDEFFGYAIWPEASFFNHSCNPNLAKRRVGRSWEFWADREIKAGEELTISYLGGDEKYLDVAERRRRLRSNWGFECGCSTCENDASAAAIAKSEAGIAI